MYRIIERLDETWLCECRIQDGTERWDKPSRADAIRSMITAARVLNGAYILESDIVFEPAIIKSIPYCSNQERQLLDEIRTGHKVVLEHDDPRVKMRIQPHECELIQKIREGDVVWTNK